MRLAPSIVGEAIHRIEQGEAIALPLPSPLAYCVVASSPEAINDIKGRPRNQGVASWVSNAQTVLPDVSINEDQARILPWLLHSEGLTVLVSPRADQPLRPDWLPSYRSKKVLLFGVSWPCLDHWMTNIDRPLYVSSANLTGTPSAVLAAEAQAQLPTGTYVVDGDKLRDSSRKHGSTTMVSLNSDSIQVVRKGIQDAAFASTREWLEDLIARAPQSNR